jgi:hypothetical protein
MFEVIYDCRESKTHDVIRVRVLVNARNSGDAERIALLSEFCSTKWIVSSERLESECVVRLSERKI